MKNIRKNLDIMLMDIGKGWIGLDHLAFYVPESAYKEMIKEEPPTYTHPISPLCLGFCKHRGVPIYYDGEVKENTIEIRLKVDWKGD